MLAKLKRRWRAFAALPAGRRFQRSYQRHARDSHRGLRAVVNIVLGLGLMAAGALFLVIPGPGIPIVVIGAALIARQSLLMSKALDWIEVQLRAAGRWGIRAWRQAAVPVRVLVVALALCVVGAAGLGAYRVLF